MDLLLNEGRIIGFVLILLRVSAFIVSLPAIGSISIPNVAKIFLALGLSVILFSVLKLSTNAFVMNDNILLMALREVLVGLIMGFLFRFFFFAISIASEFIGLSSGLSSAQIYNPSLGMTVNVFEQMFTTLATILLFALNGHHLFIQGLFSSYDLLPLGSLGLQLAKYNSFFSLAAETFSIGFRMAAPMTVAIFLTNLSMGILGRTVPQLNVLMTSLQVTILVGIGVLLVSMPLMAEEMNMWMQVVAQRFFELMRVI